MGSVAVTFPWTQGVESVSPASRKRQARCVRWLMVLAIEIGAPLFAMLVSVWLLHRSTISYQQSLAFAEHGQTVAGEIIARQESGAISRVGVRYLTDTGSLTKEFDIPTASFTLRGSPNSSNEHVELRYLRGHPQTAILVGTMDNNSLRLLSAGVLAAVLGGGMLLWKIVRWRSLIPMLVSRTKNEYWRTHERIGDRQTTISDGAPRLGPQWANLGR